MTDTAPRPSRFVSVLPDGVCIGWDQCGGCRKYLTACTCPDPAPPSYVASLLKREWRLASFDASGPLAEEAIAPAKAKPATATPVVAQNVAGGSSSNSLGPSCRKCDSQVSEENADQNDDGTWTCWTCQLQSASA